MTGGEALVEQLVREGTDKLFAVPGVQLDWATDALRRAQNKIRVFIPRHEQATSYMADGYARTTGDIGVCMVVPGPGLLNAMAGLATAYACNSRVLCISANIHSTGIGKGQGLLHEINRQSDVLSTVTKWNGAARTASEIPGLVREAFRQLKSGRPQPVGIEIPHDVLATTADMKIIDPPTEDGRRLPVAAEIAMAAALLNNARYPVIYAGGGVLAARASAQLRALAERLGAPVVIGENGRGSLSDNHPLALNAVGGRAVFQHADVALIVGSRFVDVMSGKPLVNGPALKRIYLNVDPNIATRNPDALFVNADATLGLEALAAEVTRRPSKDGELKKVREWVKLQTSKLKPQTEWIEALRSTIPVDGILINELTQVGYFARSHYEVYEPGTFITPGYQGTLGYGFPTALGAAVGANGRVVVSITGDGGFGWSLQELATAARYNLRVVVIVFNDGKFGNVRTLQMAQFGAAFGETLQNPDFGKLAEAFGVRYAHVPSPQALKAELKKAFDHEGPTLIEAPVGEMPSPWHLMRLSSPPFPEGTPPNPLGEPKAS
jgi:acetolactate synthase-1/2/3 large subunit